MVPFFLLYIFMITLQSGSQVNIGFVTKERMGIYTCESGNGIDDKKNYTINVTEAG